MDKKAFHGLLKKYLDGKCTHEERRIVDGWYDLLDDPAVHLPTEADEIATMEKRLWKKIQSEAFPQMKKIKKAQTPLLSFIKQKWWAAAAILSVAVLSYLWFSPSPNDSPLEKEKALKGLAEETNLTQYPQAVVLEDGSKVTLKQGSKIAYPKHFLSDKREIFLEGEAFFEVSKNPSRPFFVYHNNLVTKVLGTSFNIKTVKDKIEVDVRTGRVAVYENGSRIKLNDKEKMANGVIITPNQKVTYYAETRHFVTSLVDMPLPVPPKDKQDTAISFKYDDTPLREVLASIEKVYGIDIILENDNLKNCPFTGDITRPPLFKKLEFICQVFGASYEIKGTNILIEGGKSCN